MKILELIEKLGRVLAQNGNLEVLQEHGDIDSLRLRRTSENELYVELTEGK